LGIAQWQSDEALRDVGDLVEGSTRRNYINNGKANQSQVVPGQGYLDAWL